MSICPERACTVVATLTVLPCNARRPPSSVSLAGTVAGVLPAATVRPKYCGVLARLSPAVTVWFEPPAASTRGVRRVVCAIALRLPWPSLTSVSRASSVTFAKPSMAFAPSPSTTRSATSLSVPVPVCAAATVLVLLASVRVLAARVTSCTSPCAFGRPRSTGVSSVRCLRSMRSSVLLLGRVVPPSTVLPTMSIAA